jgi:hypothetical protein
MVIGTDRNHNNDRNYDTVESNVRLIVSELTRMEAREAAAAASRVVLRGMTGAAHLNGKLGTLVKLQPGSVEHVIVRLDDSGGEVAVKFADYEMLAADTPTTTAAAEEEVAAEAAKDACWVC